MKPEYDFSAGARGRFFYANAKLHLPDGDLSQPWTAPQRETARENRLTAAQESASTPQNLADSDRVQHVTGVTLKR